MKKLFSKKINGYSIDYFLVNVDEMEDANDGKIAMGLFITAEQQILIYEDQCEEQIHSTIIHETLEAINQLYYVQLKHSQIYQLEGALKDFMIFQEDKDEN